jgi:hypothetical protein
LAYQEGTTTMPARHATQVRYITDGAAVPPHRIEAVTRTEHALAFLLSYTWDPARPDHGDGAAITGEWGVMPTTGPAAAEPVWLHYDRAAQPEPWRVGTAAYRLMGDAMEAAVGY